MNGRGTESSKETDVSWPRRWRHMNPGPGPSGGQVGPTGGRSKTRSQQFRRETAKIKAKGWQRKETPVSVRLTVSRLGDETICTQNPHNIQFIDRTNPHLYPEK